MDVEKYRKLFLEECREHLQSMNRELLRLEAEGEGFDGIDTLFREAHSIKGMSGSMGYTTMVHLSHVLEDVLDGIRKKTLPAQAELIALLFEGVDLLGKLADEVEGEGSPVTDVEELVGSLRAAGSPPGAPAPAGPESPTLPGGGEEIALEEEEAELPTVEIVGEEPRDGGCGPGPEERAKVLEAAREGRSSFLCRIVVSEDTSSLTARNFVVLGKLNKIGTLVRSTPSLPDVLEGRGSRVMEALVATEKRGKDLLAVLNGVPELKEVEVTQVRAEPLPPDKEEKAPGAGDGEISAGGAPMEDASRRLIQRYLPGRSTTVRVDTGILDDLINIVGELIIRRDRLLDVSKNIPDEPLHESLDALDLLVRGFRDTIMAVRMMPLEIVTDRLPRIVRDLARQGGKEIRFEIIGQGIELDRAILEEISDVLIHLVRNAIDHGVEPGDERRSAGKEPKALVRIAAGRERDWVSISVEDDGRGMDAERIRKTALERGLVTAEQVQGISGQEALLLSCLPGLSTAEKVSDISGRGVGMDVVKSRVESFGGSLQIETVPGAGTKTTMRLPLTLAIIQALLVEAGGQSFALPVSHVAHALKAGPGEVERSGNRFVMRWQNKVIPLGSLGEMVGLGGNGPGREGPASVVMTEHDGRLSGLVVDSFIGTCEAVIKPLGLPLKNVPGLAGAAVIGDGRTVLVLDLKAIAGRAGLLAEAAAP